MTLGSVLSAGLLPVCQRMRLGKRIIRSTAGNILHDILTKAAQSGGKAIIRAELSPSSRIFFIVIIWRYPMKLHRGLSVVRTFGADRSVD